MPIYKGMQGDHIQYTQKCFTSVKTIVNVIARRSWKNDARVMENQGKIMDFDFGKALGTLFL